MPVDSSGDACGTSLWMSDAFAQVSLRKVQERGCGCRDGGGPAAGVQPVGRKQEVPGCSDRMALQLDRGGQEEPGQENK